MKDAGGVMPEIHRINLRRLRVAPLVVVPLHAAHVAFFSLSGSQASLQCQIWKTSVIYSHAIMAVWMLAVGWGLYAGRKTDAVSRSVVWGAYITVFLYLCLGAFLSVVDQLETNGITAFLTCTVGAALVFIVRPILGVVLYAVAYALFFLGLKWTQPDPNVLLSLRVQGLSAVALSVMISYMLWKGNVVNIGDKMLIRRQNEELRDMNEQLAYLAVRDPLTGLYNRRFFMEMVEKEFSRNQRHANTASILLMDIDHFKQVNDRHGHPVGDGLLKELAATLTINIRKIDILARFGGEEFIMLLPETPLESAGIVGEHLRGIIENKVFLNPEPGLRITASFGAALLDGNERDMSFKNCYQQVDEALYRAKQEGRNRVVLAR